MGESFSLADFSAVGFGPMVGWGSKVDASPPGIVLVLDINGYSYHSRSSGNILEVNITALDFIALNEQIFNNVR